MCQWSGLNLKSDWEMPRKCIVKVVLSKQQREILDELARRLGTSESETLRMALMDYAKELSLVVEIIHRKTTPNDTTRF
jgi:ribulose bisphosphate carboxylase small subunit